MFMEHTNDTILTLGISQCLLGEKVRFDGGHKRDPFLTDLFSQFVKWVSVCPEVEAGFGTPREAMRLVGEESRPRLLTIKSKKDLTSDLERYSVQKIRELSHEDLDGFVFKKDSPSCGTSRVRLYNPEGHPNRKGVGIFAQAFITQFPLIPVEEEGRLNDHKIRDNFIERVFCYHRFRILTQSPIKINQLIEFHTHHKLLLLAHSRPHYEQLGQIVAKAKTYSPRQLQEEYGRVFMEGLKVRATIRKHVNVLQHILGYFKKHLSSFEKSELQDVINDYHHGLTPLIVPLTLVIHYVRVFQISYLANQVYLNPHPKELMLRNHV
jgi:uncharacterized protein YbgA (DUF1722 family)/uncharacterized protein YbbK (DUF523 family)